MSSQAISEGLTSADPLRRALADLFYTYAGLRPDEHVAASIEDPTFCAKCQCPWPCPVERALRALASREEQDRG